MPYWQLFYHLVWSTKNRQPLLEANVEAVIYDFLRSKAIGMGATVLALNGIIDHVHMVAAIPPKIAVATFIGQIKAVASTRFNKSGFSEVPFFWQEEYGVFSFDGKRLPSYIAYVECQKEHHAQNTTIPVLERTDDAPVKVIHEMRAPYAYEDLEWRRDLESMG
jgi:putative transposase